MNGSAEDTPVRELLVISGKGGTGKTSIVASFAVLSDNAVLADCDVDAADLHLLLSTDIQRTEQFYAGHVAVIRADACIGCGECEDDCRFGAIHMNGGRPGEALFRVDPVACEGCGVCVHFCPTEAIDFPERWSGEWFVSETRCGPMVHARLGIAEGNSGKLVSTVRQEAKRVAQERQREMVIVDGPPGIGCPVIASLTGVSLVLVVTEPTLSGEHDLERVLQLTNHFGIATAVCVNKWDVNPSLTEQIERKARESKASVVGRVRYDRQVTSAQIRGHAAVEEEGDAADDIRAVWRDLQNLTSRRPSLISLQPSGEPA